MVNASMKSWIAPISLGLLLIAAVLGTLWISGRIALPGLGKRVVAVQGEAPTTSGQKAEGEKVFLTVKPLKAYDRVTAEMLMEPGSFRFRTLPASYFPPQEGEPPVLVGLDAVVGRVLRRDKEPNRAFTEADFFPLGTREGVVAGVPSDRRALVLNAAEVPGLHSLRRDDQLDVLTTDKDGKLKVLAEEARVVAPVEAREIAGSGGKIVEEATLAVTPQEVETVMGAIARGEKLFAVARSGQPEESSAVYPTPKPPAPEKPKPKPTPTPPQVLVESIVGNQREVIRFLDQEKWEKEGTAKFEGETRLESPARGGN
ncbi:MAG: hypothetical protein RLY93_04350 [Sumerlaeia bacterium]